MGSKPTSALMPDPKLRDAHLPIKRKAPGDSVGNDEENYLPQIFSESGTCFRSGSFTRAQASDYERHTYESKHWSSTVHGGKRNGLRSVRHTQADSVHRLRGRGAIAYGQGAVIRPEEGFGRCRAEESGWALHAAGLNGQA